MARRRATAGAAAEGSHTMNETAAATETNDDRPTTPDADAVAGQGDSSPDSTRDQRRKKSANRPAMQIYRPPGVRNGTSAVDEAESTAAKPSPAAGTKQPAKINTDKNDKNNDKIQNGGGQQQRANTKSPPSAHTNGGQQALEQRPKTASPGTKRDKNFADEKTERSASAPTHVKTTKTTQNNNNYSAINNNINGRNGSSETSTNDVNSPSLNRKSPSPKTAPSPQPPKSQRQSTPVKSNTQLVVKDLPALKKRQLGQKEMDDIKEALSKLDISKENDLLRQFSDGNFESGELATSVASTLVQYAIEEARSSCKAVAKLCASLLDAPAGQQFHRGLATAAWQYFECRSQLRADHFKFWIAFLNFVSDLYANIGFTYDGELVDILFRVFDYMLKSPVLETLKIEELECLIGSLLGVGYDLERQCPDQLVALRDSIRDALISVHEPWARKMILLLMELSACGWKLPAEANEYYFQTAANM